MDSLIFLVHQKAMNLYAYVIMPNHIHLIIKPLENRNYKNLQLSFMRYTAQKIKFYLEDDQLNHLNKFLVNRQDRVYQIWQRNPLAVELCSQEMIEQKLNYIHSNPVHKKWRLSRTCFDYQFSSIRFYEGNEDLCFLTHYLDG